MDVDKPFLSPKEVTMNEKFLDLVDLAFKTLLNKSRAFYFGFCLGVIFTTAWVLVLLNIVAQFVNQ